MAMLGIITKGNPVLRQKAEPVDRITKAVRKFLNDMGETMYNADGCGLAAPQVNESKRLVVLDAGDGLVKLVNPSITELSDEKEIEVEGCLSIPGVRGYVPRSVYVQVEALDEKGKPVRINATGLLARILQHEIDHLNGVLFTDRSVELSGEEER